MAKSGKGQSAGTAGDKSAAKDTGKKLARLEKRLQKARDVEAKRKKQASEARAEVAQLTARIKELKPDRARRDGARLVPCRLPGAIEGAGEAGRCEAGRREAGRCQAGSCEAGRCEADGRARRRRRPRGPSTSTSTRRKTATSPATRTARTRKAVPADGSGDGTGPS